MNQRNKDYRYKLYKKFTSLLILLKLQKEVAIDFITELLIDRYSKYIFNIVLVAVNKYTKIEKYIFYNKIITIKKLAEFFIKKIQYKGFYSNGIINERGLLFTRKLQLKIYYYFKIKF